MATVAEDAVIRKGTEIFRLMAEEPPAVFGKKYWAGRMMEAAMEHPDFKVALFRFIDVLPTLETTAELTRHLEEYFLSEGSRVQAIARALVSGPAAGMAAPVASLLVRRNITSFSKIFIAGRDPREAARTLRKIRTEGGAFTVDLLGEAAVSETEADGYRDQYLSLVDALSEMLSAAPQRDPGRVEHSPPLNVSIKVSSLYSRIAPVNYEDSVGKVQDRLRPVLRAIRKAGGQAHIDMETFQIKDLTLDLVTGLLEEPEFQGWDRAGVTLQAYLKSAQGDLERIIQWANRHNRRITVRLVKGAYWEYEKTVAGQRGWPPPVFTRKTHTDWNYERCLELALANHDSVSLAVASHNVRSLAVALALAERRNVPRDRYEVQVLFGMAEPLRHALETMGHTVRQYVPGGELIPGMAYLVRRLLENTSDEGFLRKRYVGNVPVEELLEPPEPYAETVSAPVPPGLPPFRNEPAADFSVAVHRERFREAIEQVIRERGHLHPIVLGGREHDTADRLVSVNPHAPEEVVCSTPALTRELADDAVAIARAAQTAWGRAAPAERAELLFRAAAIARRKRFRLAAWEVLEVGKSWTEADADVCEAIDYLEYYGREMIRLGNGMGVAQAPGESNRYFYQPRGVGLVVAPWNFPLAISMGMVSAALVTGNAVLYKPSSLSLKAGWLVFDLLREAGAPDGVLNFLPGRGSEVGDYLVEHPHTDFILFTGSLAVGLGIVEKAGRTRPGQKGPKKVVIETGGKNAILVDADADLDQAVPGVIQSAFGFQGQKCSACSRVIVLADAYDRFVARLAEAVQGIPIGDPRDPKNFGGPVIDAEAQRSILEYIESGKRDGTVLAQAPVPPRGYYVPPTVFADLPPDSRVLKEEIFGPVLSVVRVRDIDEAIAVANSSIYALTGGVYSRSPGNIRKVSRDFSVGNLYINRGITGAMVGRQPFGGFRMSGVGSKAGGPDYLQQFLEPRVVTENTMRRGFAPEDAG